VAYKVLALVGSLRKASINGVLFNSAVEVAIPKLPDRINRGVLSDETTRELVKKQLVAFEKWIGRFAEA